MKHNTIPTPQSARPAQWHDPKEPSSWIQGERNVWLPIVITSEMIRIRTAGIIVLLIVYPPEKMIPEMEELPNNRLEYLFCPSLLFFPLIFQSFH